MPCNMANPSTTEILCSNCHCHPIADRVICGFEDWCSVCDTSLHAAGEEQKMESKSPTVELQPLIVDPVVMSSFRASKRSAEPCFECCVLTVNVVRRADGIQTVCERCVERLNDERLMDLEAIMSSTRRVQPS